MQLSLCDRVPLQGKTYVKFDVAKENVANRSLFIKTDLSNYNLN